MQVTAERRLSKAAVERRRQIVDAAVVTLAELGYQRASFVEITRRAGLSSTRLISYHFDDRDELMAQVASQIIGELGTAVESRVRAADSPGDALRAYIDANLKYMDGHRVEMGALTALLFAGALHVSPEQSSTGVDVLEMIIDAGRRAGQFRDVDCAVAATIVQRAVEGVPLLLRDRPDADLIRHARELIAFFDAALLAPARAPAPAPARTST
jgi:AcrR family transcriptional regulator